MADYVELKFQYLVTFERFGWMPYLTTQHLVNENLLRVLFSNATLEKAIKRRKTHVKSWQLIPL